MHAFITSCFNWKTNNSWGCNGFDGDFETRAAIRGSGTTLKPGLNINAEDNLALAA